MSEWKTYLLALDCSHTKVNSGDTIQVGDEAYCLKCRKYSKVLESHIEYRAKCCNCRYGKKFGAAKYTAGIEANKHHRAKPNHRVIIYEGEKIIEVIRGIDTVDFDGEEMLF